MAGRDYKGARGPFVINILIVLMFSWVYANVQLTKLYNSKMCSLLYIKYTSIKLFKICVKRNIVLI